MTEIFAYGSLDLTDKLGITSLSGVKDILKPYIYENPRTGHLLLNVVLLNKQEADKYGYTHDLIASKKGVKERVYLIDLKEHEGHNANKGNASSKKVAPQTDYSNMQIEANDLNF